MRHRASFLAAIALCIALPCLAGPAGPAAPERSTDTIRCEDLLAATLAPTDLARLGIPVPDDWWPAFPEFNARSARPQPLPGERFYVVQNYARVSDPDRQVVECALTLYQDAAAARRAFRVLASADARGAVVVRAGAARFGDECRYTHRTAKGKASRTTLRFRIGAIVGRVSAALPGKTISAAAVARSASAMGDRVRSLLAGELAATPMPTELAVLLPQPPADAGIGPALGAALLTPRVWARTETTATPRKALAALDAGGATRLGFRRYETRSLAHHVIEVTVLPFRDAGSAAAWVRRTRDGSLDPGASVPRPAFFRRFGATRQSAGVFELQFAKGPIVCDVTAFAPFGNTAPACEAAVRAAAKLWSRSLPSGAIGE